MLVELSAVTAREISAAVKANVIIAYHDLRALRGLKLVLVVTIIEHLLELQYRLGLNLNL